MMQVWKYDKNLTNWIGEISLGSARVPFWKRNNIEKKGGL
jgi:hypothetical protein